MWFLLWFVLSSIIFGIFGWSFKILLDQRRAWKGYAKKVGLAYTQGRGLLGAPRLSGGLGRYRVTLFTDMQITPDLRGQRYVTAIDIELGVGLPVAAVFATPDREAFVGQLAMKLLWQPDDPDWDKNWIVRTKNVDALKSYMVKERLDALRGVFTMKGAKVMYLFDELEGVLRVETADPLRDSKRLEKIMERLTGVADKLLPDDKKTVG